MSPPSQRNHSLPLPEPVEGDAASTGSASGGTKPPRLAVVGPCSSGKSLLAQALKARGLEVRQPAQEHSYVPDMWRQMSRPDILIYLDVDYPTARRRRPHQDGGPQRLADQHQRLAHARTHCHFYLDTSPLTPLEVQTAVLAFLAAYLTQPEG